MIDDTLKYAMEQIEEGFTNLGLPDYMKGAVIRWVVDGIRPGSFLSSVLLNDLTAAVLHADDSNRYKLVQWAQFSLWYIPSNCRGDTEKVRLWKGLINHGTSV